MGRWVGGGSWCACRLCSCLTADRRQAIPGASVLMASGAEPSSRVSTVLGLRAPIPLWRSPFRVSRTLWGCCHLSVHTMCVYVCVCARTTNSGMSMSTDSGGLGFFGVCFGCLLNSFYNASSDASLTSPDKALPALHPRWHQL